MTDLDQQDRTRAPADGVRQAASAAVDAAGTAVGDTAGTAREQAGQVAGAAKTQVRNLARDVRDRVGTEARSQNDRLAEGVRRFADELDEMAGARGDSPASQMVTQVSQGGRRVADYLAEHGPEGVLEGVQDFARRRPGTFLLAAAAAGFVAGRLGKGILTAGSLDDREDAQPPAPAMPVTPVPPVPVTPATSGASVYSADTQRLTPPAPLPETPQTVATSTGYTGSPAASTGGLASEPIPRS